MKKDNVWVAFKRTLANIAHGVTGRPFTIVDIDPCEKELGYTSKGNQIHLAYTHKVFETLPDKKQQGFIKGVFAHELGHQLATPFDAFYQALSLLKNPVEKKVFAAIYNIGEDMAIEYFLPCYVSGHLIRCLEFMIAHLYKSSPEIDGEADAFSQYMRALIHYGDGGLIKGELTSTEAREAFIQTTPILDKMVEEPDGKKRLILAKDIFNLSRPLWAEKAKEAEEAQKIADMLKDLMERAGKCDSKGDSDGPMSGVERDESSAGTGSEKKKSRRKITFKRISKEEAKAMGLDETSPSAGGELPEGDITAYIVEDGESEPKTASASSCVAEEVGGDKSDGTSVKNEDSDGAKTASKSTKGAGEADKSGGDKRRSEPKFGGEGRSVVPPEYDEELEQGTGEITNEEYELRPEDIAQIERAIEMAEKEIASEAHESVLASEESLEVTGLDKYYPSVSCRNLYVHANAGFSKQYQQILVPIQGGVSILHTQLKRIFKTKAEEKIRGRTGKINLPRVYGGRVTANLFDRRRTHGAHDVAVMLCIDESGSMMGRRSQCARQAAIGLAEVFAKLNIPLAVMGFTADDGVDVLHYHYLTWHNTPSERERLVGISARHNNFDGYSIRYAAELLSKRRETHKLLIVISDGQPACRYYKNKGFGISDTQNAIKTASKKVDIVGVAIDGCDTAVLHSMYQRYFVEVKDVTQLFYKLGAVVKEKVKKWD